MKIRLRPILMKLILNRNYHGQESPESLEGLPRKDVPEAGGWLDPRSLENCYQPVGEETAGHVR
jgi:hypothetical protein